MEIFDISSCEQKIGYVFKDKMLLRKAFTHASYAHEHKEADNELMEFFGDSIIEFIVTEFLYKESKGDEGLLTQKRADIVSKEPLTRAVEKLGISHYLMMGTGQKKTARKDDKMYSSLYEALACAIYLDGGMTAVKKFVNNTLIKDYKSRRSNFPAVLTTGVTKSEFQEYVQKRKLGDIEYKLLAKTGPDHSAEFKVALYLNGQKLAESKGSSKKNAQAQCAKIGLQKLKKKEEDGKHN